MTRPRGVDGWMDGESEWVVVVNVVRGVVVYDQVVFIIIAVNEGKRSSIWNGDNFGREESE